MYKFIVRILPHNIKMKLYIQLYKDVYHYLEENKSNPQEDTLTHENISSKIKYISQIKRTY